MTPLFRSKSSNSGRYLLEPQSIRNNIFQKSIKLLENNITEFSDDENAKSIDLLKNPQRNQIILTSNTSIIT